MKTNKLTALIISIIMIMTLGLTACGSSEPETLESYMANDSEAMEEVESSAGQAGISIDFKGNDLIYTYDVSQLGLDGMTEELIKSDEVINALEEALENSSEQFIELADEMEDKSGIDGIRIIVNYTYNDDVLVTRTFNEDGEAD